MRVDMSTFQYDSTFTVCFFDCRAAELAFNSLSAAGDAPFILFPLVSDVGNSTRTVTVTGFVNDQDASKCNDLLLSVFNRFGEVDTIARSGSGAFLVTFFDCRSPLSVFGTIFPSKPEPVSVTVNSEQLIQLLIAGSDSGVMSKMSKPNRADTSSEFCIDLSALQAGSEERTTIMVRNIPRKLSQSTILDILRYTFGPGDVFDFVYLPVDLENHINVGYAFINLKSPQDVVTFYQRFNERPWRHILLHFRVNCGEEASKVAKVTFARIQGVQSLIDHFANTSIMNNQPESIRPYFRL
jgi:hypothetical protein